MTKVIVLLFIGVLIFTSCNNDKNQPKNSEGTNTMSIDTSSKQKVSVQEQRIQKLEFNYTVGETLRYKMEQNDEIEQDDSIKAKNNTTLYYTKVITSNKNGILIFTMTYDSVMVYQKSPTAGSLGGNEVKFNSNDSADKQNKNYAIFNALVGQPITVTMTNKGKIEEISGLTPVMNTLLKDSPNASSIPEQQKSQMADQIRLGMFAQIIQQEQITLPDSTLDSTMTWSRTSPQEIPPLFVSTSTVQYSIGNVSKIEDHKVADVKANLTGKIELIKSKIPIPVKLKSSSMTGSGKTFIDVDRGYTLLKDTKVVLSIVAESTNPKTKKVEQMKQVKKTEMHVVKLK